MDRSDERVVGVRRGVGGDGGVCAGGVVGGGADTVGLVGFTCAFGFREYGYGEGGVGGQKT